MLIANGADILPEDCSLPRDDHLTGNHQRLTLLEQSQVPWLVDELALWSLSAHVRSISHAIMHGILLIGASKLHHSIHSRVIHLINSWFLFEHCS